MEDTLGSPPENINPYSTLNLTPSASPSDVKTAYKKLALRHHPDKVPLSERTTAHSTFQRIAFAYAILSSPHRRTLYDNTGSTAETLAADDDDFDWLSFFQTQYSSISASALNDFSASYKQSDEERKDVLAAYAKYEGRMSKVYEEVMLSNPLEDETRFREIIDGAIKDGEVEGHFAYVNETKKNKDARMKKARREADEAEAAAKANAKYQSIFGGDGKGGRHIKGGAAVVAGAVNSNNEQSGNKKKVRKADYEGNGDISDLAAMIQSRNKARSAEFFDKMEAKYTGASTAGKGNKRKAEEEPDEEAFEKTRARMTEAKAEREKNEGTSGRAMKGRRSKRNMAEQNVVEEEGEDEQDGEIDLENATDGDEDKSDLDVSEEDLEEEEVKPKRKARKGRTKQAATPVTKKKTGGRGRARK